MKLIKYNVSKFRKYSRHIQLASHQQNQSQIHPITIDAIKSLPNTPKLFDNTFCSHCGIKYVFDTWPRKCNHCQNIKTCQKPLKKLVNNLSKTC